MTTARLIVEILLERLLDPSRGEEGGGGGEDEALRKFIESASEWRFNVTVQEANGKVIVYGVDDGTITPKFARPFNQVVERIARQAGLGDRVEQVIVKDTGFVMVLSPRPGAEQPETGFGRRGL